jgi:5'(3')-deoxyribonucleotidase
MSAPRIALDLDGVVYNWGDTVRYLMEWHHNIKLEESTYWEYVQDHVPPHAWKWLWKEGVEEHGLFRYGSLYRGTADGIKVLATIGNVEVVTHRPRAAMVDTLDLIRRLPDVFHGVHILTDGAPKSTVGCDVYIDDNPAVIEDVTAAGMQAVVVDRPWNQGVTDGVRAYGWPDIPMSVVQALSLRGVNTGGSSLSSG